MSRSSLGPVVTLFAAFFLSQTLAIAEEPATQPASTQPTLKVGDPAPPLTVKAWIKGEPVTRFEPGKIYVVNFGATWCGPCTGAIPDLAWVQQKFEKDGVVVIGIGGAEEKSDGSELGPYLKLHGKKITYRLAIDESPGEYKRGPLFRAWVTASGKSGIPAAFVVGRDGRVAAMGHAASIGDVLPGVIAGTYDSAAIAQAEAAAERLLPEYTEVTRAYDAARSLELIEQIVTAAPHLAKYWHVNRSHWLARMGRLDEAERVLNEAQRIAEEGPPGYRVRIAYARVQVAATRGDAAAMNAAAEAVAAMAPDDADHLNTLVWYLIGDKPNDPKRKLADLAFVQRIAERANTLVEAADAYTLGTLARVYALRGDFARAIETQTKALALIPESDAKQREPYVAPLDRYRGGKVDADHAAGSSTTAPS